MFLTMGLDGVQIASYIGPVRNNAATKGTKMPAMNTPYGILSFPHLFQPKARSEGGEPVFSASLIFDPSQQNTEAFKAMKSACIATAKEEWGDKVNLKSLHMPFRDAGEKADQYEGYEEGGIFINPWTKSRPGIVDARRQDILLPEEVWAGQLVRMNITPFAWSRSGKQGVS